MRHFNYVRFTKELRDPHGRILVGVRCILNGRCICQIARFVRVPTWGSVKLLEAEAEAIEDEVRDTVDRMDPEVLL